ncbi:hypothetical protein BpHYR1_049194 [Brachionus plicatilis]|uniref:Uncharacterized protein n=1 Tax=Brachionus plicatilis TaxID=10195 RepID=A0A3M7QVZ0_BRAPC|nr:hypothetical protein BpHYR1_049194 [Brachionus plicatilis]
MGLSQVCVSFRTFGRNYRSFKENNYYLNKKCNKVCCTMLQIFIKFIKYTWKIFISAFFEKRKINKIKYSDKI